jgi:hypothetical protein
MTNVTLYGLPTQYDIRSKIIGADDYVEIDVCAKDLAPFIAEQWLNTYYHENWRDNSEAGLIHYVRKDSYGGHLALVFAV